MTLLDFFPFWGGGEGLRLLLINDVKSSMKYQAMQPGIYILIFFYYIVDAREISVNPPEGIV